MEKIRKRIAKAGRIAVFYMTFLLPAIMGSAQQAHLVLPVGHTEAVKIATFSPDGKQVLSADDKNIIIWDTKSSLMLFSLNVSKNINTAQYSPDNKYIICGYSDTVYYTGVWDAQNGDLRFEIPGAFGDISSNGKYITTINAFDSQIWDLETGNLCFTIGNHEATVYMSIFFANDQFVLTSSRTGETNFTKIWNVKNGKLRKTISGSCISYSESLCVIQTSDDVFQIWDVEKFEKLFDIKDAGSANMSISPNGKVIVLTYEDKTMKFISALSGSILHSVYTDMFKPDPVVSPDNKSVMCKNMSSSGCSVWDIEKGMHLFDFQSDYAVYSADGKYIFSVVDNSMVVDVYSSETGELKHRYDYSGTNGDGEYSYLSFIALSQYNQKILAVELNSPILYLTEIFNSTCSKRLEGRSGKVKSVDLCLNKQLLSTESKSVKVWDLNSGKLMFVLSHPFFVNAAKYSPDGKVIATASSDRKVRIWDSETGELLHVFEGHNLIVNNVSFSQDGKMLASMAMDKSVRIWDIENSVLLHTLENASGMPYNYAVFSPDNELLFSSIGKVWDVASEELKYTIVLPNGPCKAGFSPDGAKLMVSSYDWHTYDSTKKEPAVLGEIKVTGTYDGAARIFDASSGNLLFELKHFQHISSAHFSHDSKMVVTSSFDKKVKVWDAKSGVLIHEFENNSELLFADFSPDDNTVFSYSKTGVVQFYDIAGGELLKSYQIEGSIRAVDLQNQVLITSDNSILSYWDLNTGKQMYSFVGINTDDYLVLHADGFYDGTQAARDYLYFVCGTEIIDLAQMKDALYVPGLVEKILSGQDINYPKLSDLEICGTLPLVERVESDSTCYHYRITPRKLGVEYVEVYVNDKKVYSFPVNELKIENGIYILKLQHGQIRSHFISGQENSVKVVAVAKQKGSELRSRGTVVNEQDETKTLVVPRMFAVIVGVNDYKEGIQDLNYPAKDATDFGSALELSAKKLLGDSNVFMYMIHSNVKPGSGYTTPEKEGIRKAMEDIGKKARTEDIVLIFFAGHGVMQGSEDKKFTFLTADASGASQTGISTTELQQWLSFEGPFKMMANKSILIFDACNSGQASKELAAMVRSDDDTRRIRQVEDLRDKSGMFILSASAADQSAYELPQYEQGLLTYSLLSVLKNSPDILEEGKYLNVQKWFLESEKYLKQLISSLGYKQDAQPYGTANIRIGEVDEEVRNSIHLAAEKPVVICANVMNGATFIDDLQLKDKINEQLLTISERGTESQIFFARQETANANKINIMYQITSENVNCELRLLKNNENIYQASIKGKKTDMDGLVKSIIEEVVKYAK